MVSQILLFSQARSASHMLERMFERQSVLKILSHPFSSSRNTQLEWMRSESYANGMTADMLSKYQSEITKCVQIWRTQLAEVESNGQILMVHTGLSYPLAPEVILQYFKSLSKGCTDNFVVENCTMVPDSLLLHSGTTPVFTIRDPRLAAPSAHRTMHLMGIEHGGGLLNYFSVTNPIWSRLMYDFYVSKGFDPLVIDPDDYVTDMDIVRALCVRLGLDPEQLNLSWSAATETEKERIHPMYYASQSTLINSSKPDPAQAGKNIDLEKAVQDWDKEFGEDAETMRALVELAKPHYEYLLSKKMKL